MPVELQLGPDAAASAGAAGGDSRIYLVGPGDDRLLRSVARDPQAQFALQQFEEAARLPLLKSPRSTASRQAN